ncbi:hypothetical protein GCM10007857_13310 [Bradyrhizobium iriomotense]|uniref:Diguanylate cyclase n=1 Tax=Bradyrhizobium iriomotense TaxID=441950 RepID=A0ABQ6AWT5_9BRAD|nr:hypothetical protein GCM10007857_13310 [Bradyrhizobium iriomotense]
MQEQLAIQEKYYRALLASIPSPAWLIDVNGRFMAVNSIYAWDLRGVSPDELIGKRLHDVWPGRIAQGLWETNYRVIASRQPQQFERRLVIAGRERIVSASLSPIFWKGEVIGVAGVAHDITDLRNTIDELNERETQLRTLTENSPDCVIRLDQGERFTYVNPAFAQMLRLPQEAILGRAYSSVLPTDAASRALLDLIRKVIVSGVSGEVEVQLRVRREGAGIDVRTHHVLVVAERDRGGAIRGALAIGRDITERRRMEEQLAVREQEFRTLAENSPDNVIRFDREGRLIYINSHYSRMMDVRPEAVYGKLLTEIYPSGGADLEGFMNVIEAVALTGESTALELQVPVPGVGFRTHHISIVAERDRQGIVQGVLAIGRDITERRGMEEQLAQREQEFRALAENSPDAIVRFDADLRRLYINPAGREFTGPSRNYGVGLTPDQGSPILDLVRYKALLREVFDTGEQREGEFQVRKLNGIGTVNTHFVPEFGEGGQVKTVLAVSRDITASVSQRERIQRLAYSDSLTGLANRALFYERARGEPGPESVRCRGVGLMLLDIDHFKDVNDTLGHSKGDELLKEIAARLSTCIREKDTLARLGGDEFVILIQNMRDDAELREIAERIQRAMAPAIRLGDTELFVSCSIGITTVMDGERSIDELMGSAAEALYEAKRNGRNKAQFYRPEFSQKTQEKVVLGQALRQAIDHREFSLVFQPKCRLGNGHLVGVEALLRWRHPTLGLLLPDRFIRVAEHSGQIVEIGRWVLESACKAIVRFNKNRAHPITVAVNISPKQITTGALTGHIRQALEASGCRPAWLEIEITEGILLQDSKSVQETLSTISSMGVSIAVDDFGTGHSALAYIDRFPINVVKIDRSFTMSIDRDRRKAALVRAFVSLADALDLSVVAEGVENSEQVRLLRRFGCEIGQGYFYSKPMSAPALARRYGLLRGRAVRPRRTAPPE